MRIEVNEKGSYEFYKEVANVSMQFKRISKNPTCKYRDMFKSVRNYLILAGVLWLLELAMQVMWGFDGLGVALLVIIAFLIFLYVMYYIRMKKYLDSFLNDNRTSTLTVEESFIQIEKGSDQAIRLGWDNVAFARIFKESICFFSKEAPAIVISVDRPHMGEVIDYIAGNGIDVRIYE